MGRTPKIRRFPVEIRTRVDGLIRDGATIDEIMAALANLNAPPIARSTVGAYKQRVEQNLARYREAQEVAGAWVSKLGENPASDVGRLLQEMLKTIAFQTMAQLGDEDSLTEGVGPRELMFLAKALKDLSGAQKTSIDVEAKLRAEYDATLAKRAAQAAEVATTEAKKRGLSPETVATMRQILLGSVT